MMFSWSWRSVQLSLIDMVVMAIQALSAQAGNQNTNVNLPRLNWKTNFTCYECSERGNLAPECPHTGMRLHPSLSQPDFLFLHKQIQLD